MVTGPGIGRTARGFVAPLVLLPALVTPVSAGAAPLTKLEVQRIEFLTAEKALRAGQHERFARLRDGLEDYPLYPYLVHAEIARLPLAARRAAVERFLVTHADTPLAVRLRHRSLRRLAARGRWAAFLRTYRPTRSAELRCQRLRALLETGAREEAFAGVEELWLVPHSQHDACDPVFAAWRAAGRLTGSLVWDRIRLAIGARELALAGYLSRYLPKSERPWVDRWRRIRGQPELVGRDKPPPGPHPMAEEILADGLSRLAFRDPERAVRAWSKLRAGHEFSPENAARVSARIGLSLARRHDADAVRWLGAVPAERRSPAVDHWLVFSAFRAGDWGQGLGFIERLDREAREETRWLYWRARALDAVGRGDEARPLFMKIAGERGYYGFLAADRLGARYQMNHRPLAFPPKELDRLSGTDGFRRARELHALGRWLNFRREWYHLTRGMTDEDLARAAKLAQGEGWHGQAILALGRTPWLDDVELRFPIAFRDDIEAQAAARRLNPAWVLAIVRQESAFMPHARSPKGALGLMQIMPGTGRYIARSLNTRLTDKRQLLDTELSIRFGSQYLRTLLDRLFSHPILATAAYNAGPHRVVRWLPERKEMPADVWIETVPFTETRRYLRRVFFSTAIYEERLGDAPGPTLMERFRPIPGRAVQVSDGGTAGGG